MPKCSASRTAWVPLPAPGAPISEQAHSLHPPTSARLAAGGPGGPILPSTVSRMTQASMDGMWADLLPVGRDARDRRLPPARLDAQPTWPAASGSPPRPRAAAWTSSWTATATSGPGGATPTPTAPGS